MVKNLNLQETTTWSFKELQSVVEFGGVQDKPACSAGHEYQLKVMNRSEIEIFLKLRFS